MKSCPGSGQAWGLWEHNPGPKARRDEVREVCGEAFSGKDLCLCGWPAKEELKRGGLDRVLPSRWDRSQPGRVCVQRRGCRGGLAWMGVWGLMKSTHSSLSPTPAVSGAPQGQTQAARGLLPPGPGRRGHCILEPVGAKARRTFVM